MYNYNNALANVWNYFVMYTDTTHSKPSEARGADFPHTACLRGRCAGTGALPARSAGGRRGSNLRSHRAPGRSATPFENAEWVKKNA